MAFPECDIHSKQKCEVYCEQCDVPVCTKCIIGPHKGHDAVELLDVFKSKKQEIKKETQEIESIIIPRYNQKREDANNKMSIAIAKFEKLEKERGEHRTFWHQEVDTIFDKFDSTIKSIEENQLVSLKSHDSKLSKFIQEMTQTVQENKKLLRSRTISDVNNYKSKIKEYRKIPTDIDVEIPELKINTARERELRIELGEYQATLTQKALSSLTDKVPTSSLSTLLDKAKIIATIPTEVKPLHNIACKGVDEAWVSGRDKIIRRVGIHKTVRNSVICQYWPRDITVTRQGELMYSDSPNSIVNIVRHVAIEPLVNTPRNWNPEGLCCTRSGDLLVSMVDTDCTHHKILRYDGHKIKQEIDTDENGDWIYAGGVNILWVVENNNEDICASDNNAKMVVAVDKSGRVRFRYDGTPARRGKSFDPEHLVIDSQSQIIVADCENACLHILNQNGQLQRCLDNCGLDRPLGLSVDSVGRLWVGLYKSGEVKIIQYLK
jgi:hypothetical protein